MDGCRPCSRRRRRTGCGRRWHAWAQGRWMRRRRGKHVHRGGLGVRARQPRWGDGGRRGAFRGVPLKAAAWLAAGSHGCSLGRCRDLARSTGSRHSGPRRGLVHGVLADLGCLVEIAMLHNSWPFQRGGSAWGIRPGCAAATARHLGCPRWHQGRGRNEAGAVRRLVLAGSHGPCTDLDRGPRGRSAARRSSDAGHLAHTRDACTQHAAYLAHLAGSCCPADDALLWQPP
mmetsp:Transcript_87270/g.224778  ORF Transcript_87270/g.224778 Transcript_87270/m.224778 type:complete len:230 (+) Transcript_87270:153-842(+)